jgi:hypothetical protein
MTLTHRERRELLREMSEAEAMLNTILQDMEHVRIKSKSGVQERRAEHLKSIELLVTSVLQ